MNRATTELGVSGLDDGKVCLIQVIVLRKKVITHAPAKQTGGQEATKPAEDKNRNI